MPAESAQCVPPRLLTAQPKESKPGLVTSEGWPKVAVGLLCATP